MEKERVNGSCMGRLENGTWWAAGVGDADFGSWCVIIICAMPLHSLTSEGADLHPCLGAVGAATDRPAVPRAGLWILRQR